MRFTILTPVKNGMPFLPECVASIDVQREDAGVDVEHIVFDAGSTDGTREWLTAHARRAQLVFEPDEGHLDALEKGFARATGDVFGWLNADDILERHALARVMHALTSAPDAVAVTGACLFIDENGAVFDVIAPPRRTSPEDLLAGLRNLQQPATFFRASAYREVGALDRSLTLAFDADLFRRLARVGRIATLPAEVLGRNRVHAGSKTERDHPRSAREDLRARIALGMPMTTLTGTLTAATLATRAYVYPLLPSAALAFAKRAVARARGRDR